LAADQRALSTRQYSFHSSARPFLYGYHRRGFRRLLEDDPTIAVVGEASDGEEAIRLAGNLNPRVIVMDCALPGTSGLIATRRILERSAEVAILMLSMYNEESLVRQAFEAGARGYVPKDALELDLAEAVRQVAAGKTVLDPKIGHAATLKGADSRTVRPTARSVAAHLRRLVEPGDWRAARHQREHGLRPQCQHHENAGHPPGGRTGRLRRSPSTGEHAMNRGIHHSSLEASCRYPLNRSGASHDRLT
jgi:CheY-like chemotaxis protein